MTTDANLFFLEGCGRCSLGGTPECKVHIWQRELEALRQMVLECGLEEDCKWGMPCYTFQGKNIVMLSAFKDNCTISFFKGALLRDEHGILRFAGENSHVAKIARFTRLEDVFHAASALKSYVYEAIEIEKAGLKVPPTTTTALPEELQAIFDENPAFQAAFEALTPGRRRGYLLHFSAPKQSTTRTTRIEKCMAKIFEGRGMQD